MGQGDQVTDFTAWGTYGGVTVPIAFTTSLNGEQISSGKVTTVEINPTIDPKVWRNPLRSRVRAPHPVSGHLLPASGAKDSRCSIEWPSPRDSGERVPKAGEGL